MSDKAKRAVIKIASIEVEVFQLSSGEYVMSQSQVGNAIDENERKVRYFLSTKESGLLNRQNSGKKSLKALSNKAYRIDKIPTINDSSGRGGNNNLANMVSIDLASEFWFEQAMKGNVKAQGLTRACLEEALKRRCDKAFEQLKTEEEYEKATGISYQTWMESRAFLKDAHASFTNCCLYNNFIASVAHDKITFAVCGMTAAELRELEIIEGNPNVGLNHIKDKDVLVKIAKVKLEFSRYRTGNVDQRIERAIKAINN